MADITFPNTFADGAVASSDAVMDNLYDPTAPNQSLEEINGRLDNQNRSSGWGELDFPHIRPRAFSDASMVGKTEPMDFMGGSDEDASVFNPNDEDLPNVYEAISGASISFYLPDAPTVVIFTWQIFMATDLSDTGVTSGGLSSNLKLYIDDVAEVETKREMPFSFVDLNSSSLTGDPRYNDKRDRAYSGHLIRKNLTAGWHTASLRIWGSANLARVRVRNIKVIRLK